MQIENIISVLVFEFQSKLTNLRRKMSRRIFVKFESFILASLQPYFENSDRRCSAQSDEENR